MLATTAMYDSNAIANALSDVLGLETNGLLRHIARSNPHVSQKTYAAFVLLEKLVHLSVEHAERITRLMDDLELTPRARAFNPDVAHYHFVNLETAVPEIVKEKQQQIAAYQRAIEHIGDNPRCRAELQSLLEENRQAVDQLQQAIA